MNQKIAKQPPEAPSGHRATPARRAGGHPEVTEPSDPSLFFANPIFQPTQSEIMTPTEDQTRPAPFMVGDHRNAIPERLACKFRAGRTRERRRESKPLNIPGVMSMVGIPTVFATYVSSVDVRGLICKARLTLSPKKLALSYAQVHIAKHSHTPAQPQKSWKVLVFFRKETELELMMAKGGMLPPEIAGSHGELHRIRPLRREIEGLQLRPQALRAQISADMFHSSSIDQKEKKLQQTSPKPSPTLPPRRNAPLKISASASSFFPRADPQDRIVPVMNKVVHDVQSLFYPHANHPISSPKLASHLSHLNPTQTRLSLPAASAPGSPPEGKRGLGLGHGRAQVGQKRLGLAAASAPLSPPEAKRARGLAKGGGRKRGTGGSESRANAFNAQKGKGGKGKMTSADIYERSVFISRVPHDSNWMEIATAFRIVGPTTKVFRLPHQTWAHVYFPRLSLVESAVALAARGLIRIRGRAIDVRRREKASAGKRKKRTSRIVKAYISAARGLDKLLRLAQPASPPKVETKKEDKIKISDAAGSPESTYAYSPRPAPVHVPSTATLFSKSHLTLKSDRGEKSLSFRPKPNFRVAAEGELFGPQLPIISLVRTALGFRDARNPSTYPNKPGLDPEKSPLGPTGGEKDDRHVAYEYLMLVPNSNLNLHSRHGPYGSNPASGTYGGTPRGFGTPPSLADAPSRPPVSPEKADTVSPLMQAQLPPSKAPPKIPPEILADTVSSKDLENPKLLGKENTPPSIEEGVKIVSRDFFLSLKTEDIAADFPDLSTLFGNQSVDSGGSVGNRHSGVGLGCSSTSPSKGASRWLARRRRHSKK